MNTVSKRLKLNRNPNTLRNRYIAARHGRSLANEKGIIISTPQNGLTNYGLTDYGLTDHPEEREAAIAEAIAEVQNSANEAIAQKVLGQKTIIIASPFARTRETAHIIQDAIQKSVFETLKATQVKPPMFQQNVEVGGLSFHDALIERNFGNWEREPNFGYSAVWQEDQRDPHFKFNKVESVSEVLSRTKALIESLEANYENETFLLVGHGDPLQILETWFRGMPAKNHRSLPPLQTSEIRPLNFTTVSAPNTAVK